MLNLLVSWAVGYCNAKCRASEEGDDQLVTAEADDEKSAQQVDEDRTEDQVLFRILFLFTHHLGLSWKFYLACGLEMRSACNTWCTS